MIDRQIGEGDIDMDKRNILKHGGVQVDIYGNPVQIPEGQTMFRMAKCGHCGETVKLSQTKLHLSYGKRLNICKRCLEDMYVRENTFSASIRDPSKILNRLESYTVGIR